MTVIRSQQSNLSGIIGKTSQMAAACSDASSRASGAASGLGDLDFSGRNALASEIMAYSNRLNLQQQRMNDYGAAIRNIINELDAADSADTVAGLGNKMLMISESPGSTFSLASSEALSRNLDVSNMMTAASGAVVGGVIIGIGYLILKWLDEWRKKHSNNGGNASGNTPANSGRYVNKLPEWAKQSPDGKKAKYYDSNHKTGSVSQYNLDGTVACTYYTLRKLKDRGLGFPFKTAGKAAGKSWYSNCTDDCPKAAGKESIQSLLDQYGGKDKTIENVVVSFAGQTNDGHVLLIDKVYVDNKGKTMVKYTDNYDWKNYKKFYDINGDPPIQDISLDDFIKRYEKYNTNPNTKECIIGSVLIGAAS